MLGFIAAGAPEHNLRQELRQTTAQMCSSYLHGHIMTLASTNTGMFTATELGNPLRQESIVSSTDLFSTTELGNSVRQETRQL